MARCVYIRLASSELAGGPVLSTAHWKSMLVHPAHQVPSVSLDRCSAAHIHSWLAPVSAAAFFPRCRFCRLASVPRVPAFPASVGIHGGDGGDKP